MQNDNYSFIKKSHNILEMRGFLVYKMAFFYKVDGY